MGRKQGWPRTNWKGIWEGLNALFRDFAPPKIDLTLTEIKEFYSLVSSKYGHEYDIPRKVLMGSISRKLREGRKKEILELVTYVEEKFGVSGSTDSIRAKALRIPAHAERVADSLVNLPWATVHQIRPYLGTWRGTLHVPDGQDLGMFVDILIENGKPVVYQHFPGVIQKKEQMAIVHVTKDGKLVYGRKNRGAGWVITTAHLDSGGNMKGAELLMAFIAPDDIPEEHRKRIEASSKIPNTYRLQKD